MDEQLKHIECLLYRFYDIVQCQKQYNTREQHCNDFNFAEDIIELCEQEKRGVLFELSCAIAHYLPRKDGLWNKLIRQCGWSDDREDRWTSQDYQLHLRGYEKHSQEFNCLVLLFNKIGVSINGQGSAIGLNYTGYSNWDEHFYINE